MRILVAPDKFKGTLTAEQAAHAIAAGVREARPDAEVVDCPLADGGDGSGPILARELDADERTLRVTGPVGAAVDARWWLARESRTAIVEMAEASGLRLLRADERDVWSATSYGTGELLSAAKRAGAERVLLCVGGSASVDGGAGALQALGWRLFLVSGETASQPAGAATLANIERIEPPPVPFSLAVDVLCDVDSPLLGNRGAVEAFARQKGATEDDIPRLEAALSHWASVIERCTGRDVSRLPRGGAAGGLSSALHAALGARLVSGFAEIARRVELRAKLANCDLVLTGEGRVDGESAAGKVVGALARLAADGGLPTVAFAGDVETDEAGGSEQLAARLGLLAIVRVSDPRSPHDVKLRRAAESLRTAVVAWLRAAPLS